MKDTVYITCVARGALRMTKRLPFLNRGEIAVQLRISIPDGCFKSPILGASLHVTEQQVIQPTVEIEALDATPEETK